MYVTIFLLVFFCVRFRIVCMFFFVCDLCIILKNVVYNDPGLRSRTCMGGSYGGSYFFWVMRGGAFEKQHLRNLYLQSKVEQKKSQLVWEILEFMALHRLFLWQAIWFIIQKRIGITIRGSSITDLYGSETLRGRTDKRKQVQLQCI